MTRQLNKTLRKIRKKNDPLCPIRKTAKRHSSKLRETVKWRKQSNCKRAVCAVEIKCVFEDWLWDAFGGIDGTPSLDVKVRKKNIRNGREMKVLQWVRIVIYRIRV